MSVLRRCPLAVGLYIVFTSWLYAVRRSHSWGTDEWTVCNILNYRESNWASLPGRPRVKKQNQYVSLSLELTLSERKRGLEGGGEGKGMGGRARCFASLTPSKWRCQGHLRRGSNYTNYIVRHRGIKHWLIVSSVGVVAVLTPALTHSKDLLPERTILVFAHTRPPSRGHYTSLWSHQRHPSRVHYTTVFARSKDLPPKGNVFARSETGPAEPLTKLDVCSNLICEIDHTQNKNQK